MSEEREVVIRFSDVDEEVASGLGTNFLAVESMEPNGEPWFDQAGDLMVPLKVVVAQQAREEG